jgi:hypothetical protein
MISFKVLEQETLMLMLTLYIWKELHHSLYVIFNIYDIVVSPYNFCLYATIRVYGRFGPGLSQFLGPPMLTTPLIHNFTLFWHKSVNGKYGHE